MLLFVDNFDSFSYNLTDYFAQLGHTCHVVRNDVPPSDYAHLPFSGVVLSPGPSTPARSGFLMEVIAHYHNQLPMLGICLGHQAIGAFFGGRIEKAVRPMHGKLSTINCQPDVLFNGLPNTFSVVRYHSLLIRQLPDSLAPIAHTPEGELMALTHRTLPIKGVQFHPEAILTDHGLQMLKNWLTLVSVHF